ncbi:TPA: hypothetical protein OT801_003812 [Morganella morganii]|uniref:hypothetical protein n=1 Tax=Morganella morganii TaxID=582 RepID=UPI000B40C062|nr:hypothetical protein [Morganella morganii]ELA7729677.1 hypothetical protein [Morganella morganii]EME4040756.1 hypothetical protein [Morganella morganii]MBA5836765.1 hypothetical protein [Morganella morganii]MBC4001157.1 hypothetical protein [Morganella morganii]MBT0315109.1 hypothetical protein [Morganella morganii subsp. morganii]
MQLSGIIAGKYDMMLKRQTVNKKIQKKGCAKRKAPYNAPPLTRNNAITRGYGRKRKSGKLKNNA